MFTTPHPISAVALCALLSGIVGLTAYLLPALVEGDTPLKSLVMYLSPGVTYGLVLTGWFLITQPETRWRAWAVYPLVMVSWVCPLCLYFGLEATLEINYFLVDNNEHLVPFLLMGSSLVGSSMLWAGLAGLFPSHRHRGRLALASLMGMALCNVTFWDPFAMLALPPFWQALVTAALLVPPRKDTDHA